MMCYFFDYFLRFISSVIYKKNIFFTYRLRTNGAKHLRSAALDLSMWSQSLIDVSLIIAVGILLILAVPSMIICILLRKNNATPKVTEKKNSLIKKGKKKQ